MCSSIRVRSVMRVGAALLLGVAATPAIASAQLPSSGGPYRDYQQNQAVSDPSQANPCNGDSITVQGKQDTHVLFNGTMVKFMVHESGTGTGSVYGPLKYQFEEWTDSQFGSPVQPTYVHFTERKHVILSGNQSATAPASTNDYFMDVTSRCTFDPVNGPSCAVEKIQPETCR
jgi:hypothetical protein